MSFRILMMIGVCNDNLIVDLLHPIINVDPIDQVFFIFKKRRSPICLDTLGILKTMRHIASILSGILFGLIWLTIVAASRKSHFNNYRPNNQKQLKKDQNYKGQLHKKLPTSGNATSFNYYKPSKNLPLNPFPTPVTQEREQLNFSVYTNY